MNPPAGAYTDREGRPVAVPTPPTTGSCYRAIGDFQGAAYERNAFALGTDAEVGCLVDALRLRPGERVVDVGCGTGRHVRALAGRGIETVGVDLSHGLLRVGAAHAPGRWIQGDARALPLATAAADAVLCLCQGGFGIAPEHDRQVLSELVRLLRPGGRLALTAFSLAFAARWMTADDALDISRGVAYSRADVRAGDGRQRTFDLWTSCYSAGHLELLCTSAGLVVDAVGGVEPGRYALDPPTLRDPELLVVATKA